MRKNLILALITFNISFATAATVQVTGGELYQGTEMVNERPTGNACYLYVDYVETNPVGLHCYNLTTRAVFTTDRSTHPQDEITLSSHITNAHRVEYPSIKTCAKNLNGTTSGNEIYGHEEESLYNQLFSGVTKHDGSTFDLFVTFSPESKKPSRVRLHKLSWMSEKNYDCIKLQEL